MKKRMVIPLFLSIEFLTISIPVYAQIPPMSVTAQPQATGAVTGVSVWRHHTI